MSTTLIGTATGNINVVGDHDWIKAVLSANTLYSFTSNLTVDFGAGSIPGGLLSIYDADGHSVGQSGTQLAFMPKVSGAYYVDVSGLLVTVGEYMLTLASSPDDYFDNTATTGTVAVGGIAAGRLNLVGDSDWFKTTLTANKLYAVSADYAVALPGNAASVSIFDASGNPVGLLNSAFTPTVSGTYYLGVTGSAEGDYTLHLSEAPDDYTDNSTTAGTIVANGSAAGVINIKGDQDWFKTTLSENQLYALSANYAESTEFNVPHVSVYDENGDEVSFADASFMPKSSGVYFIGVSGASAGAYTLNLAKSADDYTDNTATTGVLTVSKNAAGTINLEGDADWFKTTLNKNTLYALTADYKNTAIDDFTSILIYDENGELVEIFGSSFMPAVTGTYYVSVSGDTVGAYTVNLNMSTDDYNDNTSTTGTIAVGGNAAGVFNVLDDEDWFKTTLDENALYEITTDSLALLLIYDADGHLVGQSDAIGTQLGFTPTASGSYYIGISGFEDSGNYSLNLDVVDDDYANNPTTAGLIETGVVSDTNTPPTLVHAFADQTASEDSVFSFQVPNGSFADADVGDTLTYSAILVDGVGAKIGTGALPAWLTFNPATQTFGGTPGNGDVGEINVKVIAVDSHGASASDIFRLTVGNVNDAPVASDVTANGVEDAVSVKVTLQGSDIDSSVQFKLLSLPANGMLYRDAGLTTQAVVGAAFASNELYFVPNADWNGSTNFSYKATDGALDSAAKTVTINIEAVLDANTPPTLAHALVDQTATEDSVFSFQVPNGSFADADVGDTLTHSALLVDGVGATIGAGALPAWLTFNPATQTFGGTPGNGDVGEINVKVIAVDSHGASASDIFRLTVGNVNDAPVASDVTANGVEDAVSVKVTLQGSDIDSSVQFKLLSLPANGMLYRDAGLTTQAVVGAAFASNELYFVPNADWNGSTNFSYKATDGALDSAAKTVTVNIGAVPDAPIAQDVSVTGAEDAAAITIQLASNSGSAVYKAVSLPANGALYEDAALTVAVAAGAALADATLYFVPNHNWNGAVSFDYTAVDGVLQSEAKTVDIMVTPVNDPPTGGVSIAGTTAAGQTLTAGNTLGDADILGDISYQWLRNGSPIAGAGAGTYVVSQDDLGQSLSVRAAYIDGFGTHEAVVSNALLVLPSVNVDGQPVKGTLKGTDGNDVFDSASSSAGKFDGGKGDDAYIVHDSAIKIKEAGKQGNDTVYSDVSYTLPNNVENLILTGTANIDAKGNALNNVLVGNGGNNILNGLAGSDKLTGGAGGDRFDFDSPLNAKKNVDTITDFISGEDKIGLKGSLFKKLGDTVDAADVWFKDSGAAQGKTGYLVYDADTGVLAYDKDGSGKAAAVQIALIGIQTHEDLQVSDFVMI